jgi:hypothetical protein
MNNEIAGVLRAVLAAAGGSLVAKGYIDAGTIEVVAGALATLIAAGWSIYEKRKAKKAE